MYSRFCRNEEEGKENMNEMEMKGKHDSSYEKESFSRSFYGSMKGWPYPIARPTTSRVIIVKFSKERAKT